jgi:hypothetical protein
MGSAVALMVDRVSTASACPGSPAVSAVVTSQSSLPFTGASVALALVVGTVLILVGGLFLLSTLVVGRASFDRPLARLVASGLLVVGVLLGSSRVEAAPGAQLRSVINCAALPRSGSSTQPSTGVVALTPAPVTGPPSQPSTVSQPATGSQPVSDPNPPSPPATVPEAPAPLLLALSGALVGTTALVWRRRWVLSSGPLRSDLR